MNRTEAEQSVLGSLLIIGSDKSSQLQSVFRDLSVAHFTTVDNREIWQSMKYLHDADMPIDLITVGERISSSSFSYLAEMAKNIPSAANIDAYVSIVKNSLLIRNVARSAQQLASIANNATNNDIKTFKDEVVGQLALIGDSLNTGHTGAISSISEAYDDLMTVLKHKMAGIDDLSLSTGIETLDRRLGVNLLQRGSLVVVGARPKMGKTAFMVSIMSSLGIEARQVCNVHTMEMSTTQLMARLCSASTGINTNSFLNGLSDTEQNTLASEVGDIINSNIYFDDRPAQTIDDIEAAVWETKQKHGRLDFICVDYLTLMKPMKADRNDLAFGMITTRLKNIAKENNAIVLLLTQLNRGLEQRQDKRPFPSDSRDTGQIEQDCDVWIGLYREHAYDEHVESPGFTEAIIRLNRHGETGTAYFHNKAGVLFPTDTGEAIRILKRRGAKSSNDFVV